MDIVYEAISHPARRKVLLLLREGPRSAGDLADCFEFSKPTMSMHLSKLKNAGLVSSEKEGNKVIYYLNTSVLEELFLSISELIGIKTKTDI